MFKGINPYKPNLLSDYQNACKLTEAQAQALIGTLKNDAPRSWDDEYPGRDTGTGSYSWSITIEYKDGTLEEHFGYGNNREMPAGFKNLKNKLYNYKYTENPMCADPYQ